jgi:hypothetical protein
MNRSRCQTKEEEDGGGETHEGYVHTIRVRKVNKMEGFCFVCAFHKSLHAASSQKPDKEVLDFVRLSHLRYDN